MKYIAIILIVLCGTACSDFIEKPITDQRVELLSPGDHAESAIYDIHFMWKSLPMAHRYRLQIASPSFEQTDFYHADTLIDGSDFKTSLNPGSYCWQVQALNGTSETAFTRRCFTIYESDFTQQTVLLIVPSTQYLSSDTEVVFKWQEVFRADQYRFQVDTNNFQDTDQIMLNTLVSESEYLTSALKEQKYQWRVRAIHEEQESKWSETRYFTLDQSPPGKPTLLSPANNQLIQPPVDLVWEPVNDADHYELFVYQADSVTLYSNQYPLIIQGTHHRFLGGHAPGRVLWRVRAYDKAGNRGTFSLYKSFIAPN